MFGNGVYPVPRARSYIKASDLFGGLVTSVVSSRSWRYVAAFEAAMRETFGAEKCLTFSSCRMALFSLLEALELEPGSEVLLTPITIPDIVNAVIIAGHVPVFVDMDRDSQNMSPDDLRAKISPRTRAAVITHLSGLTAEVEKLVSFLDDSNIVIIEDISQSYSGRRNNTLLGRYGDAAVGSLCFTKTICSALGGVLLLNNAKLAKKYVSFERPRRLRWSDRTFRNMLAKELSIQLATNKLAFTVAVYPLFRLLSKFFPKKLRDMHYRDYEGNKNYQELYYENFPTRRDRMPQEAAFSLSEFQGYLALKTFERAERGMAKRQELASCLLERLDAPARAALPSSVSNVEENSFWHFPIYVDDRSDFERFMLRKGVDAVGFGLQLCSELDAFSEFHSPTPNARYVKDRAIFLPIHDSFTDSNMSTIADAVNAYFARRSSA